jgi:hypothetical protein
MTRNHVSLALLLVLVGFVTMARAGQAQQTPSHAFDPVGRWRFFHTDGTAFTARLAADHSAATDWEGGERGIWRWEGDVVRVIYTDGWDDALSLGPDGRFTKAGWSPEADRCGAPSNRMPADRLSPDPGAPL